MKLIADRFAVRDDGRAIDLATGALVTLVIGAAGGISEQRRWTARCDALRGLHHRVLAPLLDFGALGESSRFEAWRCGGLWRGASDAARALHAVAEAVLRGCGLTVGAEDNAHVGQDGALVWVPGADTGYPLDDCYPATDDLPMRQRGLAHVDRPAVRALAEMLSAAPGPRPHVAAMWASSGSGKTTAVADLARLARLNGLSPVAAPLIRSAFADLADLIGGRSLFIIEDEARATGWPALLHSVLRAPLPHALLLVGEREARGVDGIALARVPADTLVAAIRPPVSDSRLTAWALRAAERAKGLPGRFADCLRPQSAAARRGARDYARLCVAESPATYGVDVVAAATTEVVEPESQRKGVWPAPGELAALRRRMADAVEQLSRGRHAPAIRQLRQSIGGFARRDAWTEAGDGGLVLASALLRRGRVREAQAALEETRQYASRAGRDALLMDVAALSGDAWIDLARLDDAESVIGSALAAARASRDAGRARALSLVLARCLAWRGRWADAAVSAGPPPVESPIEERVRHAALSSRIAVGQREPARAMALVTEAVEQSRSEGAARAGAAAACAMAFVQLAVNDFDAVHRFVAASISAARTGHDPLRAVRARLLLAEAERRRGRPARALALLKRIGQLSSRLPATLRARWELITALARGGDRDEVVTRHVAASGLDALVLFAGPAVGADPLADELAGVIRLCQTADDESAVLKTVCARVRKQIHAASVAFIATQGRGAHVVESDGGRIDPEIAERATMTGIPIAPHRNDDRVEAAAPVQYGGRPMGALCARWVLGCTHDLSRSPLVLTMAAAAAAPLLSAALARREQAPAVAVGAIVGVTDAVRELRSAVERAAAVPFAVMIAGESGSGKELVARALHRAGPRRDRPFCTLNCAALPDDLVEAELFGHTRGAFTGAVTDRPGVFEEAHGGTLFLDEVGELSARAQAKVLRVIQEGELRRVGENLCRRVDVRIVAATNRDLAQEVAAGRFRLDLLYRVDVLRLTVPPLRERREDIVVLAEHFWRECATRLGSRATLGAATVGALARYDWPGNVRELQNVLAALAVRSPRRGVVPPEALPVQFGGSAGRETGKLDEARRVFEMQFVRAALARSGGHRSRAAEDLGVTRQGLTKLMSRLGITGGPEPDL